MIMWFVETKKAYFRGLKCQFWDLTMVGSISRYFLGSKAVFFVFLERTLL
jgi:hypothetical protein